MNYLDLMDDPRPPASSDAIRALEQHIGAPLPAPYKALLAQSDGGGFEPCGVELPWRNDRTVLDVLFTTHPTDSYGVIDNYDLYRSMNRIPRLSCPFAPDPGGDLFLLSLEQDSYGKVFYWEHEREPEDGGDMFADFANTYELAPDFESFILGLGEA